MAAIAHLLDRLDGGVHGVLPRRRLRQGGEGTKQKQRDAKHVGVDTGRSKPVPHRGTPPIRQTLLAREMPEGKGLFLRGGGADTSVRRGTGVLDRRLWGGSIPWGKPGTVTVVSGKGRRKYGGCPGICDNSHTMDRYLELRARAMEFVAEWARWGAVVVVGPVREAADEVALAACGDALVGGHRLAFRELVGGLSAAEVNRRALVPVGRTVREALAARVTEEAVDAGGLRYFGPVAGFPGFPRALASTFEELRLNAVPLDGLRECGESGADLARLLGAYQDELAARGFADHATRVELARLGAREQLVDKAVVALDLGPRTRAERALLTLIFNTAPAHLDLRLGAGGALPQTSLESLQRYLFSGEAVPAREADGSVEIFSTSGEALECVEMARRIGAAVEGGVPFDQIAIAVRSPERYQPLVVEGLRRAGIPVYCTQGARRPDVAGRSFLALLHCAEERLSASRFAEYLSLGQMPLGQMPEDEEPRTPAAWERLVVDASVIGGPERW